MMNASVASDWLVDSDNDYHCSNWIDPQTGHWVCATRLEN